MDYTPAKVRNASVDFSNMLCIPHRLPGFINTSTELVRVEGGREAYVFHGDIIYDQPWCEACGSKMEIHQHLHTRLRHLPFGPYLTFILVDRVQFRCDCCGRTWMPEIPFRSKHHRVTLQLEAFVEDLLERGDTNKKVSLLCGLHQRTVKSIDKARLQRLYTEFAPNGQRVFRKPDRQARYLAIDEIKAHRGYKFATHIVDLETGRILWFQDGKKKDVVYAFIRHVGLEWMKGVIAVACDMNSDFQEAFVEKCPHLTIVFDHFHIVKNFNEKVISEIRKDEQRRLESEGNHEAAKLLKRSRYILMAKTSTLAKRDAEAAAGKVLRKSSKLLSRDSVVLKGGRRAKYQRLIQENELLFTVDLVKDMLDQAYRCTSETDMIDQICEIIETCWESENPHFIWFGNMLNSHLPGIVAHAYLPISSAKMEGINNKIKTVRRQAYGYGDEDYFFLKAMDSSYQRYVKNPPALMILH